MLKVDVQVLKNKSLNGYKGDKFCYVSIYDKKTINLN